MMMTIIKKKRTLTGEKISQACSQMKFFFSSEHFEKDGKRCGYLNFDDEDIIQKMDDVTESMSALK